jgi:endoglucanase Acf2
MSSTGSASEEAAYDASASTYPTGGEWDYSFIDVEGNEVDADSADAQMLQTTIKFNTTVAPTHAASPAPLLMMSLPHQQATFVGAQYVNALQIQSVIGNMIAVSGDAWTMSTPAVDVSFSAPRSVDPSRVAAIQNQLLRDLQESATAPAPDPYGFGKGIAKIGRLVLMGDELDMGSQFVQQLLVKMKGYLQPWLQGTNGDALLYDKTYGGVCSTSVMLKTCHTATRNPCEQV